MYLASVDTDVDLQLSVALSNDAARDVTVTVTAPNDPLNYRATIVVRVGEVSILVLCVRTWVASCAASVVTSLILVCFVHDKSASKF